MVLMAHLWNYHSKANLLQEHNPMDLFLIAQTRFSYCSIVTQNILLKDVMGYFATSEFQINGEVSNL